MYEIAFPNLGIFIEHLPNSIRIGNFSIAFYGMIIGLGIIIGLLLTWKEARRTGQKEDDYTDYLIWGILAGVVGARLYYVIFRWDYYCSHISEIFNLRSGGLAIYGTIIGAVIALIIFCSVKKKKFFLMIDTLIPQLALAQGLGRWGNFFNMEAFGRSYDGLLSMQIRLDCVSPIMLNQEVLDHAVMINGVEYIQVVPTFLIESLWCFLIFAVLIIYKKHKHFNGELLCIYGALYGLERMILEGLRTDSLMLGNTGIRVSQALSGLIVIAAVAGFFVLRNLAKTTPDLQPPLAVDDGNAPAADTSSEEGSADRNDADTDTDGGKTAADTAGADADSTKAGNETADTGTDSVKAENEAAGTDADRGKTGSETADTGTDSVKAGSGTAAGDVEPAASGQTEKASENKDSEETK